MRSFVIEHVKLDDKTRFITRYTPSEYIRWSILKFLLCLFVLWPLEFLVVYPCWFLLKVFLLLCELILRGIWWLIKLPFCLLFKKRLPLFWGDDD